MKFIIRIFIFNNYNFKMEKIKIQSPNNGVIIPESNKKLDPIFIQKLEGIENFLDSLIEEVQTNFKIRKNKLKFAE